MATGNKLRRFVWANAIAFLMASPLLSAHAAVRVHLRSGFDLLCDHQQTLNGQVRLYLSPAGDNYLDVAADEIVSQETAIIAPPGVNSSVRNAQGKAALSAPVNVPALLNQAGATHHLDPDLLASVVHAESGGNAQIVSRAGAQGLMQLMPATAADLGVRDSFAPEQNIAGGATYLDALMMYYHDNLALALAAYNAGPAAVDRYHGIPPYAETRRYVQRVIHDFNRRKRQRAATRTPRPLPLEKAAIVAPPIQ